MWICPVCQQKCKDNFCDECGFDHSRCFEHFPTLQMIQSPSPAISSLQEAYKAKQMSANCPCCGSVMTNNRCLYCGFAPLDRSSPEAIHRQAVQHALAVVGDLTDFSIGAFCYVWVPERSRLELQSRKMVHLGDARDFFNTIFWAEEAFAQLRDGSGTELNLSVSYKYKGACKLLNCTIPTVKSDDFWRVGISLDPTLRLKLHLGAAPKIVASAPIALELT